MSGSESEDAWGRRAACLSRARLYAKAVKYAGQPAYDDAQKVACECCPPTYQGAVDFTLRPASGGYLVSGRATVTWVNFESLVDVRRYLPSGTITADVSLESCDPAPGVTVPIRTGTPAFPGDTLVVFTSASSTTPKQYQFALTGDGTFTASCGNPRAPVSVSASMMAVTVGFCPLSPADRIPYTNEDVLSGGPWSCPITNLETATWSFTRQ